jgi:hypothetical protein
MILTEKIKIRISPSNYKHYKHKYSDVKVGKDMFIYWYDLTIGSKFKIMVKCDDCGEVKEIPYKLYRRNYSDGEWLCRLCKTKRTNNEKYGVDYTIERKDVKEKIKNTNLELYGFENPSKNEDIRNKVRDTNLKLYGNENFLKSDLFIKKNKETLTSKYNVENISQVKEIKDKKIKINNEKYGVDYYFQSNECRKKIKDGINNRLNEKLKKYNFKYNEIGYIEIFCENCNQWYKISHNLFNFRMSRNVEICTLCNEPSNKRSYYEKEIYDYIKTIYNDILVLNNKKIIKPYELDIFIPKLKIGIEFNGIYWHSIKFKEKDYHANKLHLCNLEGIKLLTIWEDKWIHDKQLFKNLISHLINDHNIEKTDYLTMYHNDMILSKDFPIDNLFDNKMDSKKLIKTKIDNIIYYNSGYYIIKNKL